MSVTPHAARVKTVYRRILKNYFDWFHCSRHRYAEKCGEARDAFEAKRDLQDPGQIELAVREAEEYALRTLSGEPYRGTSFPLLFDTGFSPSLTSPALASRHRSLSLYFALLLSPCLALLCAVQRLPGGNMFGRNVPFPLDFIKNPPRPIIP